MTASATVDVVTDGSLLVALPVALVAGLVSFVSPCVLPLVPGYLSYVTGMSGADLAEQRRGRILAGTALFVLGFTVVFASFGAFFGYVGADLLEHQTVDQPGARRADRRLRVGVHRLDPRPAA